MSSQEEPRYVRFGPLPKSRRSFDTRTAKRLAGVSVYEGVLVEPDLFRIDSTRLNEESGICGLAGMAATDRRAYFVEGEEVGRGSDGEPLVRVERIWPVPRETNITSSETLVQGPLRLWSEGPRDGSGERHLKARLADPDSPYVPEGYAPLTAHFKTPHARGRGKPVDKEKRRRQRLARKKQRASKKR